ncbi:S-adenosylmethionine decarboxylase family protein [Fibrella forsythiae]|uniref:S-adenosylmethionine decarboxylase n=1 Tax=Fibrella forsythiae TaxID=2817061 RepID=A0ABS3JC35_9BACT|nr:S-adenosylmethionine decarboxylase [Fibrella forsythiae]MBO0947542.1 S-adenosylmethionine decarboxylase [Fibrella forsythiae]
MSPKIWNHSEWIPLTNPTTLKTKLDAILLRATFNVLNFSEYHFEPFGWTALWLLGESHLAIHTFPEHGKSYLELSSCMRDKYVVFLEELEGLLESVNGN